MLLKGLPVVDTAGGSLREGGEAVPPPGATAAQTSGVGTTRSGARVAASFARERRRRTGGPRRRLGPLARQPRLAARVATLLSQMRTRSDFDRFYASLSIAGRDGTLHDRMRRGAARGRCRGKTGTLSDVSALSGYCTLAQRPHDRLLDPHELREHGRRAPPAGPHGPGDGRLPRLNTRAAVLPYRARSPLSRMVA